MARTCDICHRGPSTNFQVSHAHNRSKKRVFLNLQKVRALIHGKVAKIQACTKCLKSGKVKKAV